MIVVEALSQYSDDDLDRLARDKVDEVANLRLPREVLIHEIAAALSSLTYVAKVLAPTWPPTYAFLKLLMDAPHHRASPAEFRHAVLELTDRLTEQAESGEGLSKGKDYPLYLRMLFAAWEDDGRVDRSEALLLAALRKELGIWTREHLLLEHHPVVRSFWDSERAYAEARNHLLATGLVQVHDGAYLLPDEVVVQIRRAWDIDLTDEAYERLLSLLTGKQLHAALEGASLPLSGSKEERVERVVGGMVPPGEVLDALHINEVKDLCRSCNLPVSASKGDLIASLVNHFDTEGDLEAEEQGSPAVVVSEAEAEERLLPDEDFEKLLMQLPLDLLSDLLAARGLARSGSKGARVGRVLECPWSERTLLDGLRRADLIEVCRKLGVAVSGVKAEIVDRLVDWARRPTASQREQAEAVVAERIVPKEAADAEAEAGGQVEPPAKVPEQRAEPPSGLEEIRAELGFLEPDEQVILAVLREARSLNEREIERTANRHGLGWFLTKAHMADLVARLRTHSHHPLRARSTGRLNIYEWTGFGQSPEGELDHRVARDLIDALRQGVVPERHLDLLAVGQEDARRHLVELLHHVADGRSEFKLLRGAYGAGKTFLCSWLREQAFEGDFAVATIRVGPDQPISDLPVFFSGLVDGLRTAAKRDASALADVLESWLLTIHREVAADEGVAAFGGDAERLAPRVESRIEEELAGLADLAPGLGPALRSFYRARLEADHGTASTVLSWLRGGRALPASALSAIGVRGQLTAEDTFPRMRALLRILAGGRSRGLLLVVDELELVRRFPHARQRERAYETLRLLIDECGENHLPGCLLVATGTEQLFEDERYGIASYRALAHRVSAPQTGQASVSVRQPIINLEPLDSERLLQVALRARQVHAHAYDWPAAVRVPRELLERMVEEWAGFGDGFAGRLPRPFLREVIHLLDLCQERPEVAAEQYLRTPADPGQLAETVLGTLES